MPSSTALRYLVVHSTPLYYTVVTTLYYVVLQDHFNAIDRGSVIPPLETAQNNDFPISGRAAPYKGAARTNKQYLRIKPALVAKLDGLAPQECKSQF